MTGASFVTLAACNCPTADADPVPVPVPIPVLPGVSNPIAGVGGGGGGGGLGQPSGGGPGGIGVSPPGLAPATAGLFLCPGVGAAGASVGAGGGYCDFDFQPVALTATTFGIGHIHCEWGGFSVVVNVWNCWRVFPGQPDHPKLTDPDIIPDGMGVPWAIQGPSPTDQWPPPGLAPASAFAPPPPPTEAAPMEPTGPPPGPPPEPR
jgi:hypothetical protein